MEKISQTEGAQKGNNFSQDQLSRCSEHWLNQDTSLKEVFILEGGLTTYLINCVGLNLRPMSSKNYAIFGAEGKGH